MHRCLCDLLRIHKTHSAAYNPQSNGAVERCNRTLLSMLRTMVSEQQNDWDDHLPTALWAYRSTPHTSTGVSHHKNGLWRGDDPSLGSDAGRHGARATRTQVPLRVCKLHYTNRGPWLVLAKMGPVTYKIQCHSQADPKIVHVDKFMPYLVLPRFQRQHT